MDPNGPNPVVQSTVDDQGARVDQHADGTEQVSFQDGSTLTTHPDGRRVVRRDGETTVTAPDGTSTFTPRPPDPARGEVPFELRPWMPTQGPVHDDNSIHVWHDDRVEITRADGSVEIQHRDGRIVQHPAPPPVQGPIQPGMPRVHTVTGTDGSVLEIHPDGRRTFTRRPGETTDQLSDVRGLVPPAPPLVRPEGDATHVYEADGTQRIVEDGIETVIPPRPLTEQEVDDLRAVDPGAPSQQGPDTIRARDTRPGGEHVVGATGSIDDVRADGTQVHVPAPPPEVYGPVDAGVVHRTNHAGVGPDGSIVREVEVVRRTATGEEDLGTATLVSRPDGTHVFTRPDGSTVVTDARGAPAPPKGWGRPAVAAIGAVVGVILVLVGIAVISGGDDGDGDVSSLVGRTSTTEVEETAAPEATVAPERSAAAVPAPDRRPDGTYEVVSRVTRDEAGGATCTAGSTTMTVASTEGALDFRFSNGQPFTSARGPDDSFTQSAPASAPDGSPGTATVNGRFDVSTEPMTVRGTSRLEFVGKDGAIARCETAFTGTRVG